MNETPAKTPLLTRVVEVFLRGDVAILLTVISLALGAAALMLTPREEEPQIVVPVADVLIAAPGLTAEEIEQKITTRIEKLLYQIDGVEYVYSMTRPGQAVVTVRFYVGQDRANSLVLLYNKLHSNLDQVPPGVASWVVKPIEVDDVPIVNVTLWSDRPAQYGDFELRRLAEEIEIELQSIHDTNRVRIIGGRPRRIRVEIDPVKLAARETSVLQVADALRLGNVNLRAGEFEQQNREFIVDAGQFFQDSQELADLVVNVSQGRPVYLRDVATIADGAAETREYSWIGFGPAAVDPFAPAEADEEIADQRAEAKTTAAHSASSPKGAAANAVEQGRLFPAVHVSVAKRKGSNAVWVANAVEHRMRELAATQLPDGVFYRITRNYGETANEKVNDLVESLVIAVLTVVGLIGVVLGWRSALVIALAIPVCYSVTLFINLMVGYTINRVTLFALILALGLLVDDPITDVENIARYFAMRILPPRQAVLRAIQEVRPALVMSTLAIIASFLPLMFITGMMGPYMAPMAMNVPLTITASMVVSFCITPWLAMVALRRLNDRGEPQADPEAFITRQPIYHVSRGLLGPVLDRPFLAWGLLGLVGLLFVGSMMLPVFRLVPLKMLPYDNKNEFQIVVDMPEGSTLEQTEATTRRLGEYLLGVPEVRDAQLYVGTSSPMDFNGMIRHYFLREGPNVADIRVNLAPKRRREQQSHEILLRIRDELHRLAESDQANIKLVETPPGPPVISTITAEIYGPPKARYSELIDAAKAVAARMGREPGVVDVDTSAEADQSRYVFVTDKPKAALSGVSTQDIAATLQLALGGNDVTVLHDRNEVNPLQIELRVPRAKRSALDDLENLYVVGRGGELVQLGALGEFERKPEEKTIYHKNLRPVAYVFGEVAGRPPADAIIDMDVDRRAGDVALEDLGGTPQKNAIRPTSERSWLSPGGGDLWTFPEGLTIAWAGEGEWKITLDVFRDLGIAFGAALVGIFVLLMFETRSRMLPLIIMLAIPLTAIGIMPGFWLLNVLVDRPVGGYANPVFFTATAMIGMIALAGIVVRNSVVLIDFIHHGVLDGLPMREAVIRSVAIRMRPILLTSGTTLLGNWVITLDPIFSGLAWSIMFGMLASTAFTLFVIPVVYWLLYRPRGGAPAV